MLLWRGGCSGLGEQGPLGAAAGSLGAPVPSRLAPGQRWQPRAGGTEGGGACPPFPDLGPGSLRLGKGDTAFCAGGRCDLASEEGGGTGTAGSLGREGTSVQQQVPGEALEKAQPHIPRGEETEVPWWGDTPLGGGGGGETVASGHCYGASTEALGFQIPALGGLSGAGPGQLPRRQAPRPARMHLPP